MFVIKGLLYLMVCLEMFSIRTVVLLGINYHRLVLVYDILVTGIRHLSGRKSKIVRVRMMMYETQE